MKKCKRIAMIVIVGIMAVMLCGCESCSRTSKSIASDFGGGLYRTVTVYSNTGEEIKSWSGKFDVTESASEVYFDLDGKRIIIHGGIVINEEN